METDNMRIPEEREIDLVDLMVSVLLHWRGMLVAILVGAIALGAYSYVKTAKEAANVTQEDIERVDQLQLAKEAEDEDKAEKKELQELLLEDEIDTEAVEELMSESELRLVKLAVEYNELYEIRKERMENSPIMKIDPMHVYQANLMFSIEAESSKVYALGSLYETAVDSNELCEYVQKECGITEDLEDIMGLRSATRSQNSAVTDTDVYIFGVYIEYYDKSTCKAMAEAVVNYLNEYQEDLSASMYEHTLTLISNTQAEVTMNGYTDSKWSLIKTVYDMKQTVVDYCNSLSIAGNMYFDYLTTGEIDKDEYEKEIAIAKEAEEAVEEEEETTVVEPAHVEKKYVLVGAFLFVCLYAGFFAVLYIFNNRLKETDNFQELYGLSQLAYVSDASKKKGRTAIDRWLYKLRRKGADQVSLQESVELAAVAVKMMAQRYELKQVCLAGSKLDGQTAEICQQISELLAKDGVSAECLNNVLGNPDMMQRLDQTKGVVLVETIGVSGYKDIENELLLMSRQNIRVLGGIMVGNN